MKRRCFSHMLYITTSLAMITVMFFVIPHAGAAFKYIKTGMEAPDITLNTLKGDEVNVYSPKMKYQDTQDVTKMMDDLKYRTSLGKEHAVDELKRSSGTQFDPEVIKAFLRVVEKRKPA